MEIFMKIALCDDEDIIMINIKKYINEYNPDYFVDMYNDGEKMLCTSLDYNIIILDIEMPGISGMKIAKQLREKQYGGEIVFLTSYGEYIEDAFKVRAYRFLHKPIIKEKLFEALDSVNNDINDNSIVIVKQNGKDAIIKVKDIVIIEAYGDGTYIYTKDKIIDSHETLKYWMSELGNERFFQLHKSYCVSFEHIKVIDKQGIIINYYDCEIPVARRRWKEFKSAYYKYIRKRRNIL